ncbi:MAG: cation-transporting P-type ATPase [Alphaproteobacteria bacterium]|jgi:magnesium-transporting ATPase (P-type)|nr:cation-transporting P-type ATPase [Alphaproteobacteria bacterium]MBT5161461.1 cation-transporting P-type ATPase [Alphaproteobacteria bacterium]MBT5919759.1 cation-transporting P-type ATPase [Alphaproteobacteria bacterium]MBT6385977.1 cation-transporting P-type ATPase [Alphaproteobacteria bacterium]
MTEPESNSGMQPAGWHSRTVKDVRDELGSDDMGLGAEVVLARLSVHGPNLLKPAKRSGPVVRFLAQFNNMLLYVLIGSAVVTALLEQWVDTGVIVGVVVINAIVGFVQEGKSERALEAIQNMLSPQSRVRRGGKILTVPAEDLVPGDIVLVQSGDRVPADLRLFDVKSLQIQESALTGESEAVEKATEPVDPSCGPGDRRCMAFAGTVVTYGKGTGVVVETAERTEIGKVSSMISGVQALATPLLRKIDIFSRWLSLAILAISVATFLYGHLLQGYRLDEMFMAVVGLAVAAIPEGLPAVMTITLAIGVTRMARRNAIIRRLPAVETLGSVTVICSDKTGTLTHNELMVQTVVTARDSYTVTGSGYAPVGEFHLNDEPVLANRHSDLVTAARAAVLCNDAELVDMDGHWHLQGNPTDGALMAVGMKAGLDVQLEQALRPRTDLIPFESVHKFMATLNHDHEGHGLIYVKGAPERILEMCIFQRSNESEDALDRDYWLGQIEMMASGAQRVLAIASRATDPDHLHLRFDDVEHDLTLIAMFGLIDPPRSEAIQAVNQCLASGTLVKMITGDHATTARAIGSQFGLGHDHQVLSGSDLDKMSDGDFSIAARDADVFARTSPAHKLRLVEVLQAQGHIVAMTGDGVNDAPALKRADIGIAMGRKGTDAAREAAEMVLTDDNFSSIMHAVEEGRTVYDNLRKSILFLLPVSGGQALTILAAVMLAQEYPITPVQILWVNMVTAVTLGLALAFEQSEIDVMSRPPRTPDASILSPLMTWRTIYVSILLLAGAFGLFEWQRTLGAGLETARTVAVNALVMGEIGYLFSCRRIAGNSWNRSGLTDSKPVLIAVALVVLFQLVFTYLPVMQTLFGVTPIDAFDWIAVFLFGLLLFSLVELEKAVARRFKAITQAQAK